MMRAARVALALIASVVSSHSAAESVAVDFVNASRPTRCAEEDNVYVKLLGPGVGAWRISAEHPPYIAAVAQDSTAPDFTDCDMSKDPSFAATPRTVVLHEDATIRLVGHRFASFWRPDVVDFFVDGRNEPGLHLVQLLRRRPQGDVELLVVYPADGYWRVKPLPPPRLDDSAYGSSFLFGPVEESSRPFVAIRSLEFDPTTLSFRLIFANQSRGLLRVAEATGVSTVLSLMLDPPVASDKPFAALRSMFVSPVQADVAVAAWPAPGDVRKRLPILEFDRAHATTIRFGRVEPSRHNLSAPDLVFDEFTIVPSR